MYYGLVAVWFAFAITSLSLFIASFVQMCRKNTKERGVYACVSCFLFILTGINCAVGGGAYHEATETYTEQGQLYSIDGNLNALNQDFKVYYRERSINYTQYGAFVYNSDNILELKWFDEENINFVTILTHDYDKIVPNYKLDKKAWQKPLYELTLYNGTTYIKYEG